MYTNRITRSNPGFIAVLIDRSYSMSETLWGTTQSKADVVADAVNDFLYNLCISCWLDKVEGPRPYLRVAVLGYGLATDESKRNDAHGSVVESAFHSEKLRSVDVVTPRDLGDNPKAVDTQSAQNVDSATAMPRWVDAGAGYSTPMCEAMFQAGVLANKHVQEFPDCFPPLIINISDGEATDEPFSPNSTKKVTLDGWADRLKVLETTDGRALLLNVYMSHEKAETSYFPSSDGGLPAHGKRLFALSSELPLTVVNKARANGVEIADGARGLIVNASETELINLLNIGTSVVVSRFSDG